MPAGDLVRVIVCMSGKIDIEREEGPSRQGMLSGRPFLWGWMGICEVRGYSIQIPDVVGLKPS